MLSHLFLKISLFFYIWNVVVAEELNESILQKSTDLQKSNRQKKIFSLFTIVHFPNDQCTAKSGTTTGAKKGTCLSSTECAANSGTVDGNCASGFGVCCVYKVSTCSSSVTYNCTYIQNPSYSSVYTTSGSCTYSVTPVSTSICQLRLDFEKFVTAIGTTGACTDSFVVTGPSNSNGAINNLCGTLTGQHLYVEQARSVTASTLAFTIGTTTTVATWNIKVSQIECSSRSRAPHDCAQYLTGPSGLVQSYNWQGAVQIQGNDYTSCVRREDGYCAIGFYPAQDGSTVSSYSSIDTFQVDATAIAVNTNSITGTWSATIDGYVMISNDASGSSSHSSDIFAAEDTSTINTRVYSYGPLFQIVHVASSTQVAAANTGFYLQYEQIPCGQQLNFNEG